MAKRNPVDAAVGKRADVGPEPVRVTNDIGGSVSITGTVTTSRTDTLAGLNTAAGNVSGITTKHIFGFSDSITSTSFAPISFINNYRMPQSGSATTLRVKAGGDANDAAGGSGAREITLTGIDANGDEISEAVATNGASASSATTASFMRLTRAEVTASGTYADSANSSMAADITIEDSGGTNDWATIQFDTYGRCKSQFAAYTVPNNKNVYIQSISIDVDSGKAVDILLAARENILETAAPYTPMLIVDQLQQVTGHRNVDLVTPVGPFAGPCDIVFFAKVDAGTGSAGVDFELLLEDTA